MTKPKIQIKSKCQISNGDCFIKKPPNMNRLFAKIQFLTMLLVAWDVVLVVKTYQVLGLSKKD